jgi:(heptosyl)LPS beta-1,4-glucosyltransferase
MSLIAIILTFNEADNIAACIDSVAWADAVLVVDSLSTDETPRLAEEKGTRVVQRPWKNYTDQRNAALHMVDEDWVYFVDADERSSPEQAQEIRAVIQNPDIAGFWVPRHNYIFGKLTRGAGWFPDYQLRLMLRAKARYDETREVHELVLLDGPAGHLTTPLVHFNYRDMRQFVAKQERYTDYAAQEMFREGVRPRPQNYVLQPLRHFLWRFVTLKGYQDGLHGLRLSLLMAWYEFQKYVRLRRLWRGSR